MRIDGGTADFDRVMFGGNESGDLDSVNTYGLFCLNGGTLNLGGGGIAMGSKWNPAASRAWDSSSLAFGGCSSGRRNDHRYCGFLREFANAAGETGRDFGNRRSI